MLENTFVFKIFEFSLLKYIQSTTLSLYQTKNNSATNRKIAYAIETSDSAASIESRSL